MPAGGYDGPAMRILVAPQEFKGSLTAAAAADAIARGLRRAVPDAALDLLPIADGGPGTVAAVVSAGGGRLTETATVDPLGRPITAAWALLPGDAAVIEMAAASGLLLLRPDELDPRRAFTYGTGVLVRAALDAGCRRLVVGVGGSATNDGGTGCAAALGVRFLDAAGQPLPPGGAPLAHLERIDVTALDTRLAESQVLVASDVTNPLLGPEGASAVYAPQKGAGPADVIELERGLARLAEIVRRDLGLDLARAPGAGAAGGLGYGLMVFCRASARPGFDLVAEYTRFDDRLAASDLLITGEGRLDAQTAFGKGPGAAARRARAAGKPVIVLAGAVEPALGAPAAAAKFDAVITVTPPGMPEEEAFARAGELLAAAGEAAGRRIAGGAFGPLGDSGR